MFRGTLLLRLWVAAAMLIAAPLAYAQDGPIVVDGDAVLTTGLSDGDVSETDFDARLGLTATSHALRGLELGAGGGLRVDGNRADNRAAGGRYSSFTIGGQRGVGPDSTDVFVDRAYVFAKGGFGSVSLGSDVGVAEKLAVTSPTIFRALGVNDWRADPSGFNDVHTVNDFSGNSAKITYMPPAGLFGGAIGNFQMGVSYAPELESCGLDDCSPLGNIVQGQTNELIVGQNGQVLVRDQRWRDVSEAALYYQNGFSMGGDRLLLGIGASFVRADQDETGSLNDDFVEDYEALALGLNLAYGDLTIGGSVKTTNAGLDESSLGESDYLAFDAGVTYQAGDWRMMLGYGEADAERDASLLVGPTNGVAVPYALDRRTQTAQAGVAYVLGQGITLGAAAQFVESDKPAALGGDEDTASLMIESSIRF
ncbi:MAG: porin [Pseudomonadota bacterium]